MYDMYVLLVLCGKKAQLTKQLKWTKTGTHVLNIYHCGTMNGILIAIASLVLVFVW